MKSIPRTQKIYTSRMLLKGISCLLDMALVVWHAPQFLTKLIASLKRVDHKKLDCNTLWKFSPLYGAIHRVKYGSTQAPSMSRPRAHISSPICQNPI